MNEYLEAIPMAHNMGRSCIVLSHEQPWQRDYWLSEARRHFARARWYIAQIRSFQCLQNTSPTPIYTPRRPQAIITPPQTPYEQSKERVEELYAEAKGWLDGEPITSQAQADEIQKLMRLIQEAEKVAESHRKAEAQPFDDGKAEVQARYNPLIRETALARPRSLSSACKSALAPWLKKLDDEQRAAAEKARQEAEEKRLAAMEAMRQRDAANLADREAAEALVAEAKKAEAEAKKAENAKPQAKGAGRAASLRTYYTANVTDYKAFARHLVDATPGNIRAVPRRHCKQDGVCRFA